MKYEFKKWNSIYAKMLEEFGNQTVSEQLLKELSEMEESIAEKEKKNLFNSPTKDLSIVSTHFKSGSNTKEIRAGLFLSGRALETPHCWSKSISSANSA